MPKAAAGTGTNGAPGSQTLARGLSALQLVAAAPSGLTAQQVADDIGVHRTIAYRLLTPSRSTGSWQGRRRPLPVGVGAGGAGRVVRQQRPAAEPAHPARACRRSRHHGVAADRRGRSAGRDRGDRADATSSTNCRSTRAAATRWTRGGGHRAAGQHAAAARRADLVPQTRKQGWVITHGEVEPNTYGLAVPVRRSPPSPPTCINLISHREDVVMRRQRRGHQGGQRIIGDPRVRIRQPKG